MPLSWTPFHGPPGCPGLYWLQPFQLLSAMVLNLDYTRSWIDYTRSSEAGHWYFQKSSRLFEWASRAENHRSLRFQLRRKKGICGPLLIAIEAEFSLFFPLSLGDWGRFQIPDCPDSYCVLKPLLLMDLTFISSPCLHGTDVGGW